MFLPSLVWADQASHECLKFEPNKVIITGMITTKDFAGAPNFESIENGDAKETAYILQTSHPICVNGDPSSDTNSESANNQTEFQLVMTDKSFFDTANQYMNKQISVNGSLFSWVTGHHHTRVLINVDKILVFDTNVQTPISTNIQPTSSTSTSSPLVQVESCYKYGMALDQLTQCANQGNVNAQYALGDMYGKGENVLQDKKKAFEWFSKAATQGDADAQNSLGAIYAEGKGAPQDYKKAVEWYSKAAEQGDKYAQSNLGVLYYVGKGVPQNTTKAFEWFAKSAEQGNVRAQIMLGDMYAKGEGVQKDSGKAFEWLIKASEQGDADAQNKLGTLFAEIPMNGLATAEFLKAAEQGNVSSMFNLGGMYQRTGDRDYVLSYMWFNLAAIRGNNADAIKERDILVKKMTPDQIAKAQQMSTDWLAKHPQK